MSVILAAAELPVDLEIIDASLPDASLWVRQQIENGKIGTFRLDDEGTAIVVNWRTLSVVRIGAKESGNSDASIHIAIHGD